MENLLHKTFRARSLPSKDASQATARSSSDTISRCHSITRWSLSHQEIFAIKPTAGWSFPSAFGPRALTVDQLVFALKYEGVQPLTLKRTFEAFDPDELTKAALAKPTSAYLRRLCHLFEWLTGHRLDVPDVSAGIYVDLVDERQQYTAAKGDRLRRFRITHNLPGVLGFCPVVSRTHRINTYLAEDLSRKARQIVESAPRDLISRAAAFLLLSDSKASFAIEGESPPRDRLARWGFAIGRAGSWHLDVENLIQLQATLIGDNRLVPLGLRSEGGFVGRHDSMNQPVPEHISARADDIRPLLDGLVSFAKRSRDMGFDAVLTAACIAFGFVYIHPFEDGNGRIHRFLMHHVLADRGFTPAEIVFPISSVILDDVVGYKSVLEAVARPLVGLIEWAATGRGNVEVLNDTIDFYSYFDATAHCEFLFRCIERSVERDLPDELGFLEHRDAFHRRATEVVDMENGRSTCSCASSGRVTARCRSGSDEGIRRTA